MLRDIDRQPVAAKVDPLAGFKRVPGSSVGAQAGVAKIQGFVLTVSQGSMRLSMAAAEFFAGTGTEYVEILTSPEDKRLALLPSTQQSTTARHLTKDWSRPDVPRQTLAVGRALRDAIGEFDNINLYRFRYRFTGELVDDGAAGVLIFDVGKPRDATRVKGAK